MTTREKIIVGVMCLTIVYGAYELLGSSTTHKSATVSQTNPIEELRKFAADVTQKMTSAKIGKEYLYMVKQASADWTKEPLLQSTLPLKQKLIAQAPSPEPTDRTGFNQTFTFTGFLQIGNIRMAVINGKEYAIGEALDIKGYYLKSASEDKAVIGRVKSSDTIQVPLTELD
jgi:hypothetical protein